jgi:hypothetical protein
MHELDAINKRLTATFFAKRISYFQQKPIIMAVSRLAILGSWHNTVCKTNSTGIIL